MRSLAVWGTILLSVLFLSACGGGGGSAAGTTPSSATSIPNNNPTIDQLILKTITISDPVAYYNYACDNPNIQHVIPVNINNDGQSDFIVHYWCGQPQTTYGTTVNTPTPDALVVHVSQPDGTYRVANEEVFGTAHIGLGGASRKYVRGDINGDGRDDFAFAMNYEDGRSGADWNTVITQPSILMSTYNGGYEVVRIGTPNWGHSVGMANNADGTVDVYFAGFVNGLQAFRYENGGFIDVTNEYPADGGEWSYGVKSINANGITEYIITSAVVADPDAPVYTVLKRGAKLYKRMFGIWTEIDSFYFPADFTVDYVTWSNDLETNSIFTINNDQYILYGFDAWKIMKGGLSGFDNDLIVGKMAASQDMSGEFIEGVTYDEDNGIAVQMYQFFEFSDDKLTPVESPIINEEIVANFNFFDTKDINDDGYPDLISYAFTQPYNNTRIEDEGRPIVYLNDGGGNLVWTDISELPGLPDARVSSLVYDINNDNIVDLILFGLAADEAGGEIQINVLTDYME